MSCSVVHSKEIISLIQASGMQGLGHDNPCVNSKYVVLMEAEIEKFPILKNYISPNFIVTGGGWSVSMCQAYGLTYEGIRQVLAILKIKAPVADSLEKLEKAIFAIKDAGVIVTDASLLKSGELNQHAISVFVQKKEDCFLVSVNDSFGNTKISPQDKIMQIFKNAQVEVFVSENKRQANGEVTCNGYAIRDCIAFNENSKIIEEILEGNWRRENAECVYELCA